MKEFKIDNKGSKTLFQNKILESLTRTHFAIPVTLFYIIALACVVYSIKTTDVKWFWYPLNFFSGMLIFTLVEYLIHRFVFHFTTKTEKEVQLQYNIHGIHHEFPRDKDRLVMPPVLSILISSMFFLLFKVLFDSHSFIVFGGFCAGYSTYLVIHYAVHALRPPKNFLKYLWTHHSLHHYAGTDTAFSVSFPLWDYLFGTMPKK